MSLMLSAIYAEYLYAECHNAECRYAECHYAKCRGAVTNTLVPFGFFDFTLLE